MGDMAAVLDEMILTSPMLSRAFFVSVELAVLVPLLFVLIRVGLVRTHRMQAVLWAVVLLNAGIGLLVRAPLGVGVWDSPTDSPAVSTATAANIQRPQMRTPEPFRGNAPPVRVQAGRELSAPTGVKPGVAPKVVTVPFWSRWSTGQWLTALWMAGAAFFLARLLVDRGRLWRLLRRTKAPQHELAEAYEAESAALRWRPVLRVTEDLETPAIAGVLRPAILVPGWLEREGSREQWRWTLCHELTHWRHGDTFSQLLRLCVQVVLFFHPFAWWAGKRWEEAAELACDRALLKDERDAVGYAQELCELLGMIGKRQRPLMSTGLFASRSHIGRRIEILLADPFARAGRLRAGHRAVVAVVLFGLLGVELGVADGPAPAVAPVLAPVTTTVAAPDPAAPPQETGARVLQFPEEYSMGTLHVGGDSVEARGRVEVPAGTEVYLRVNEAGAADLSPLAAFNPGDIQQLSLARTPVHNDQLANLQHLTGLTDLNLRETPITDDGMQYLGDLTALQNLNLNSTDVGDNGMQYVANMTAMVDINLNRTQVGDAGLAHIQNMGVLQYLDLWMLDVTDTGMQYLAQLRSLRELGIEDTLITDAGLRYLEGLENLDGINLENNNITDAGLESLAKIPNLTRLNLADTYLSDAGMATLARFPRLQQVELPLQISPDARAELSQTAAGLMLASQDQDRQAVTVRVTGEGRPLPDTHFQLVEDMGPGNEEVHFYRTDATGIARMYLPRRPAAYRLRAFAQGYVTDERAWEAPAPSDLRIDLARATLIGGSVVDTSGEVVPGVAVSVPVLGTHNWDAQEPLPHSVTTDAYGNWTCDVAPKELTDFWVSLDHPDYATTTYTMADLSVAALRDSSAVLTIGDPIGLPGFVVDSDGNAVAGARVVEMEPWRQRSMRPSGRTATTDASGTFEIRPIRPGETELKVDASGHPATAETVFVAADMAPVRIVLSAAGTLRALVVGKDDVPLADVEVYASVRSREGISLGSWSGKTDDEGRFVWDEAPDGPIGISLRYESTGRDADAYHHVSDVAAGDEEQILKTPFSAKGEAGLEEGQALIERYNKAHAPEAVGNVALAFRVEERFEPGEPPRIRRYQAVRAADGRYREILTFGEDGEERVPMRQSWNGTTQIRHGYALPGGDKSVDENAYVVSEEAFEANHLIRLDWVLHFIRSHSPTERFDVMAYEDGVLTLGDDGEVGMTMRIKNPVTLAFDQVEYFNDEGRKVLTVTVSDWWDHQGFAYPKTMKFSYGYAQMDGEATIAVESFTAVDVGEEDFTWTIPAEPDVTLYDSAGTRIAAAADLETDLMSRKAYGAAIAALRGD